MIPDANKTYGHLMPISPKRRLKFNCNKVMVNRVRNWLRIPAHEHCNNFGLKLARGRFLNA